MSGHSKWSQIKRQKGAADIKRGQTFTKLGRELTVSAREGGPDPDGNPRLRQAIQRAREASMPADTIERAIKRATGGGEGASLAEVAYEGYGPGGAAILVEALTDNRNRAVAEIRSAFTRAGGSLGESGSVAWLFEQRGVIAVDGGDRDPDELGLAAIDAGAEDVSMDGDLWEIVTGPADLAAVRGALEQAGVELQSAEIVQRPTTRTPVEAPQVGPLMRLIQDLEDHDDVQAVHANFDVDAEMLERVAAA